MKILLDGNSREYIQILREKFDSRLLLGQERYVGWCIGKIFSVSYNSGAEFMRRNYPIMNRAMGIVRDKGNKTEVSYYVFRGITDPISVAVLFLLTSLLMRIVGAPSPYLFGLGWTVAVALPTWFATVISETGQEGKEKLDDFLSRRITHERDE